MGLRYVQGLREAAARCIVTAAPFTSMADLARRSQLHRDELERLGEIGACASLGLERREAMWQMAALQGDLLSDAVPSASSPLQEMSALETTLTDYRGTGITTGPHLMSHLRSELQSRGVSSAEELKRIPNGEWVRIAGVVIVRQRPATAKGFLFITLEDETGISNAIVVPKVFQSHRALLQTAGLLMIEGPLQNREGVIHVRAQHFRRLDADAHKLPPSHDFR
jgi:error-prone DNA polymerase